MLRIIPLPDEDIDDLLGELPDPMTQFILTQWALEHEELPSLIRLLEWRLEDLVKNEDWPKC